MVSTGGSGGGPGPPSAAAAVRWLQARRCGQLRGAGNGNSAAGPRAAAGEGAAGNGRGGGRDVEGRVAPPGLCRLCAPGGRCDRRGVHPQRPLVGFFFRETLQLTQTAAPALLVKVCAPLVDALRRPRGFGSPGEHGRTSTTTKGTE